MAELTLLIPGLLDARVAQLCEGSDLTSLELILSRAERIEDRFAADCFEGMLCRAMAIAPGREGEWPVAAITRQFDEGRPRDGWHLRADPVHARAALGEVNLFHPHELTITMEEARTLARAVNGHFHDEPWRLEALHPKRWYIECALDPGITTEPLSRVTGVVMNELLPRGEQGLRWRAVLNEIQMLLHTHPVNEKRTSEGLSPINSVWIWGVGKRPVFDKPTWDQLCSDHHLGEALAAGAGLAHSSLSIGVDGILATGANRLLVGIDYLDLASRRSQLETWRAGISRVVDDWFGPIVAALRAGALGSVEISLGDGRAYRLQRSQLRRWWRRRRSIAVLAQA